MKTIRILILEQEQNNIKLLQSQLQKSGLNYVAKVAQTKSAYENALSSFHPDLILADYALPSLDGPAAFHIRQEVSPETPFIMVSGTIGEETVELIKMGMTGYVGKDKLEQLPQKIQCALQETAERKQKQDAQLQLRQREQQLQKMINLSLDLICTLSQDGRFVTVGAASKLILDYLPDELRGRSVIDLVHQQDKDKARKAMAGLMHGVDIINLESRFMRKSGAPITLLWSVRWDAEDKREITWMQSHVVRAPLARLMGLVSLLENNYGLKKASAQKILGYVSSSAHELDGVIREIVKKAEKVKEQPILEEQGV